MATNSKDNKNPPEDKKLHIQRVIGETAKNEKDEKSKKKIGFSEQKKSVTKCNENVVTITTKEHFESVLSDAGDKIIMVEFFATWCGPCRILSMKLEELAALYREKAIIVKVDIDDFEDLAEEYNITSMPAFMIMKNKKQLHAFSSSKVEHLESALEKYTGSSNENASKD